MPVEQPRSVESGMTATIETLIEGVRTGNRLALARAISRVENEQADAQLLLRALYPHSGQAHIIGVTGAPGTGKSTLVTALAQAYRSASLTVGIVAIDPTSPFTGGAILGDRVRMRALSGDSGAFVRSMATRGSLGGLSKTTGDVVTLLDAAGFQRIIVETVGVGQAEVAIASTAHTTVVIEAPGLGDEVQAIKAGILEIADLLVVNKADRPGADRTTKALEMMLELESGSPRQIRHHGQLIAVDQPVAATTTAEQWQVTVLKTVATNNEGVDALRDRVEAHRDWLQRSGEWAIREQVRIAHALENILRAELNRRILAALPQTDINDWVQAIHKRVADPYTAAQKILAPLMEPGQAG
ncbi:MAG: methylmalonyl Co-A mutase-associated GTPase MeaB [Caldilinea sp. CFX5]|nr:methylmalonyl Co-A mutase-associated GTPase MeaB [Caldilinea sp. CFX5]